MLRCDKCGKIIKIEDMFYNVEIVAKSGFSGVLKKEEESIEELAKEAEHYTENELLREIFEKKRFVLCVRCKEIWMANPLNKPL
jgi:hypothetical protein